MRRLVVAAIVATGLVLPATSASAQPDCVWRQAELPIPPDHQNPLVKGIGGDYTVASASYQGHKILRWYRGQVAVVGTPSAEGFHSPVDVSSNGTVLATRDGRGYVTSLDGMHKFLPDPQPDVSATPVAINGRGDVAGYATVNGDAKLVLWSAPGYDEARIVGNGMPAGIDDTGVIVTKNAARYLSPGFAWPLPKPAGATSVFVSSYENGVAVGSARVDDRDRAVLWGANGTIRYVMPSGIGYSGSSQGTVFGLTGVNLPTIWRAGEQVPLPNPWPMYHAGFVTERDTLVGSYLDQGMWDPRVAEWSCG
ncbi:hypothetical protein KIPE111705_40105 [Kibdelosporangium persicum]|uniref:Uncharacterized protein n=1 Tax=Kibdelosporangium persicum TaxID=2698649 RepID=A0ABX2FE32_9PSEU|nr:hypothetical protein [Kibdelosporangium persicum]NRN69091.1 hypothetical protein [Kibdelosporangium persicum]